MQALVTLVTNFCLVCFVSASSFYDYDPFGGVSQISNRTLDCYCEGSYCENGEANGTCTAIGDGSCFAQAQREDGIIKTTRGCLPPETGTVFQCKAEKHFVPTVILCCNSSMCNQYLTPTLSPDDTDGGESDGAFFSSFFGNSKVYVAIFICSVVVFCLLIIVAVGILYLTWKKRQAVKQVMVMNPVKFSLEPERLIELQSLSSVQPGPPPPQFTRDPNGNNSSTATARPGGALGVSTLQAMAESSGSGKGVPLLVQMTISRQFNFVKQIGEGGFGSVWKATWFGDPIAVKIFSTVQEESWIREKEIYQTNLLRHDNILGFIAADIGGTGTSTQMLLVMEYHELGSLYDFLQERVMDTALMLRLLHSTLSGLSHLHNEIVGSQGHQQGQLNGSQRKPPIAHRDLKSKNILVKNNLTCCIADLGHCARLMADSNEIDLGHQTTGLVGTKRYMPPEVITDTIDRTRFASYKACDMYNMALIMWEVAWCCAVPEPEPDMDQDEARQVKRWLVHSHPYSIPYQFDLPTDPSVEEVHQVVCVNKVRPEMPRDWQNDEIMSGLARIMWECWSENPENRQSSLRVKKSLHSLCNRYQQQAVLAAKKMLLDTPNQYETSA